MAGLKEIGNNIAVKYDLTKQIGINIVEDVFKQVAELSVIEHVKTNIGVFKTVRTNARPGRNPRTGEGVTIPARAILRFKARKG